jgi:hypothetical protein
VKVLLRCPRAEPVFTGVCIERIRRAVKSGFDKLQDDIPRIDIDMMQVLEREMTLESLKTVARYLCVPIRSEKLVIYDATHSLRPCHMRTIRCVGGDKSV